MKMREFPFLALLVSATCLLPGAVTAQVESRLGTIDAVMQDDGYIVIDDNTFDLKGGEVSVSYRGREVRLSFLSPGITIRYTTDSDGVITRIELIGPANVLEQLDSQ